MIRSTLSALVLSASALAIAPGALAAPACPAEIVSPSSGATVSATPTIQATADNRSDCDPNVKDVRLDGFGINFEDVNFFETKPGQFAAEFFGDDLLGRGVAWPSGRRP